MSQKMLIDASHNEETRVVVLESKKVEDFDFESLKKLQLSGNIYLAKVTRVEPSLQAAFLDYGGNRHGFLAFSEIHPDYYQIPIEERQVNKIQESENPKSRRVSRKKNANVKPADTELSENDKFSSEIILEAGTEPVLANSSAEINTPLDDKKINSDEGVNIIPEAEEALNEETFIKKQHRKFRIQEVIKVRQILLIQIVKEERGNKGAALTTYLSLAGRYCVLMPNTPRGGGISRKITNLADRKKLKEIANSLLVPEGSGLIIRTAGSNRTKLEIKRDYEYLIRQWEQVRDLTLSSIAPTTIYEEGSLIKRAIRDLYSRTIDEILVEGERGYREAKDYMKMLMPSHAKNVKKYENSIPLFSKYQVEDHLAAMFNPIAQLRSGGYIVIDVTEALVAVDVNSGRATKESSIEDTALKTNLEAAEELSRQIKLRDLAGLIVIDFIDMEDRKNNIAVEKRMKDRLKNDRARTQVGRISMFGLLEMSRQRLRPGMIETSTQPCDHCHGTGITRSEDSLSLAILRELEEEGLKNIYRTLTLQVPTKIANYILNEKRDRITTIENRYSLVIRVESQNNLISPEYKLEKIKGITQSPNATNSIKIDNPIANDNTISEKINEIEKFVNTSEEEITSDDTQLKRRRRRRRKPRPKPLDTVSEPQSVALTDNKAPKENFPEEATKILADQSSNVSEPKSKQDTSIRHSDINKKMDVEKNPDRATSNTPTTDAKKEIKKLPKKVTNKSSSKRMPAKTKDTIQKDTENKSENDKAIIITNEVTIENTNNTLLPSKKSGWWSKMKKGAT